MTLSEIETTLEELTVRHPDLTTELLTTMLSAAGWEQKHIQDAVILFKRDATKRPRSTAVLSPLQPLESSTLSTMKSVDVAKATEATPALNQDSSSKGGAQPLPQENLTFYLPDGTEEGELHVQENSSQGLREEKSIEKVVENSTPASSVKFDKAEIVSEITQSKDVIAKMEEKISEDHDTEQEKLPEVSTVQQNSELTQSVVAKSVSTIPTISLESLPQATTAHERESLLVHDEKSPSKASSKPNTIPEDLPLIPFESSPHVWSFARYKNVFHKDSPLEEEQGVTQQIIEEIPKNNSEVTKAPEAVSSSFDDGEEILLEKTPMSKGDESLVFLAGLMLLAIILILGYMYSNGRL